MKKTADQIEEILKNVGYKEQKGYKYWIPVSTNTIKRNIFHVDLQNSASIGAMAQYKSYVYCADILFLAIL